MWLADILALIATGLAAVCEFVLFADKDPNYLAAGVVFLIWVLLVGVWKEWKHAG